MITFLLLARKYNGNMESYFLKKIKVIIYDYQVIYVIKPSTLQA